MDVDDPDWAPSLFLDDPTLATAGSGKMSISFLID